MYQILTYILPQPLVDNLCFLDTLFYPPGTTEGHFQLPKFLLL